MPSRIENELMIPKGLHALSGLELLAGEIRIRLRAWEPDHEYGLLVFPNAKLLSFSVTYDSGDSEEVLDLPWDIIGFESDEIDNSRWRFILATDVLEIAFESVWPTAAS